jgi:putative oxidoreductase
MNTFAALHHMDAGSQTSSSVETGALDRVLAPSGRVLFALIFIASGLSHFSAETIAYAAQVGLPMAGFLVPASGVLAAVGGLSVALGWHARLGAMALLLFLVPVTVQMHVFWAEQDPMMAQMQFAMFMKNVSMMGAALLVVRAGAGPVSLDARAGR